MSVPNFSKHKTLSLSPNSSHKKITQDSDTSELKVSQQEMGQSVSAYQMFTLLERPKVLMDLGNIGENEVVDEIARRWSTLDDESKANLGKLSGNDAADEVAKRWTAFDKDSKGKLNIECNVIKAANVDQKECKKDQKGKEQEVKKVQHLQEGGHLDNYFAFLLFNWRSVSNSNINRSGMEIQEIIWKQWLQKKGQGTHQVPSAKSKKKIRDSNAPKKPLSGYILFANSQRAELVKSKPNISNKDVMVELGKLWNSMDEESKKPYVARSNELKVAYHVAVEERKLQREAAEQ